MMRRDGRCHDPTSNRPGEYRCAARTCGESDGAGLVFDRSGRRWGEPDPEGLIRLKGFDDL